MKDEEAERQGRGWPPASRLPTWSETKQMPSPYLCPALRIRFCWEWLLLIQVCPQKALAIDRILFTLLFPLTSDMLIFLAGSLPERLNEGSQACTPAPTITPVAVCWGRERWPHLHHFQLHHSGTSLALSEPCFLSCEMGLIPTTQHSEKAEPGEEHGR